MDKLGKNFLCYIFLNRDIDVYVLKVNNLIIKIVNGICIFCKDNYFVIVLFLEEVFM